MNLNNIFFKRLLLFAFCFSSLNCFAQEVGSFPEVKKLEAFPKTEFLPTLEHPINKYKNCIYAASLLYCWDEIRNVVGQPLVIEKSFKDLTLLNESKSYLKVLNPNEYKTSVSFEGDSIKAKAEFNKSLPLKVKLKDLNDNLQFDNIKIDSFGLTFYRQKEILKAFEILYYKDEDNFIIKLNPKEIEHEIILYKSSSEIKPTMVDAISDLNEKVEFGKKDSLLAESKWQYEFQHNDILVIPKFNFNLEHDFLNLVDNIFTAKNKGYVVAKAYQRTAFLIDQDGAKVESEAIIEVKEEEPEKPRQKIKVMKFDKPFLIVLKRVDNKNPYFAMWVANAELMQKE